MAFMITIVLRMIGSKDYKDRQDNNVRGLKVCGAVYA